MPKEIKKPDKWTRPEVKRIGQIKDVAGSQTPISQGNGQKS